MSRSGYIDDCEQWNMIRWRGAVASAIRGKRGQAFLREMLAALDAMPDKRLIAKELAEPDGSVCAIGAVGKARGINMDGIDPDNTECVSGLFGISDALTREIVFVNDEDFCSRHETPEQRYLRMREWVESQIKDKPPSPQDTP